MSASFYVTSSGKLVTSYLLKTSKIGKHVIDHNMDAKLRDTRMKQLKIIIWEEVIHTVDDGVSWEKLALICTK